MSARISAEPTPYAVHCIGYDAFPGCGTVYLTGQEYDRQMCRPNSVWTCPHCGSEAAWDDENYEAFHRLPAPQEKGQER